MGHFHYHATEQVFADKWKLCEVADNDCPRIGTTPDPDIAPAHGIPRPSLIEATATHRLNPSASFSCWDFTLTALVYRLACHYGERLADYSVTFTQKNAKGDWVAL